MFADSVYRVVIKSKGRGSKLKSSVFFLALLVSLVFAGINCDGTRRRTADLDITKDQVEAKLNYLSTMVSSSSNPDNEPLKPSMKTFTTIHSDANSTLFYAESPGSLGPIDIVMPLKHNLFFSNSPTSINEGALSKTYAFFVLTHRASGPRGSLIIAGKDSASATTPVATPTPTPPGPGAKPLFEAAATDTTPTPTPTPSSTPAPATPIMDVSFVRIGANDDGVNVPGRNDALNPGAYSDTDFAIELNMRNQSAIILRSDDLVEEDGDVDLAETIKLEVYRLIDGQEVFLGQIILTQPQ
jgi:cell division septation protein DedD